MTPNFTIIYEDHHLIAVSKPAPLLTQSPPGIDSMELQVKAYLKEKYAKPTGVYLGVPHRLDRPVTGVLIFARNTKAAQRVHQQFHDRTVRKVYWALVSGDCPEPWPEVWRDHLKKLPEQSHVIVTPADDPLGKLAELHARKLKSQQNTHLIELYPLTGRSHQLRVQCARRGLPIIGDEQYSSTLPFGTPHPEPRERTIALHARTLEIIHPFTKQPLILNAPLPDTWPAWPKEYMMKNGTAESAESTEKTNS